MTTIMIMDRTRPEKKHSTLSEYIKQSQHGKSYIELQETAYFMVSVHCKV